MKNLLKRILHVLEYPRRIERFACDIDHRLISIRSEISNLYRRLDSPQHVICQIWYEDGMYDAKTDWVRPGESRHIHFRVYRPSRIMKVLMCGGAFITEFKVGNDHVFGPGSTVYLQPEIIVTPAYSIVVTFTYPKAPT